MGAGSLDRGGSEDAGDGILIPKCEFFSPSLHLFHLHLHSGTLGSSGSGAMWSQQEGKACVKEEVVELTALHCHSQGCKMEHRALPPSFQAVIN